jgi:hypothetical protein
MLNFVKNAFRNFIEVILWINLVGCAITGGIFGYGIDDNGLHAFLGVILGVLIGIISNIILGGLIATLLNIDKNLSLLRLKFVGVVKNGKVAADGEEELEEEDFPPIKEKIDKRLFKEELDSM